MQCNKCKYTTDYNAFLVHHVRQHPKKKDPAPVGEPNESGDKQDPKRFKGELSDEAAAENNVSKIKALDPGDSETVEMIAAEINDFNGVSQNHSDGNSGMVITSVTSGDTSDGTTSIVMTQGEDGQLTALTGTGSNDTVSPHVLFSPVFFSMLKPSF